MSIEDAGDRVRVERAAHDDPVLGLDPEDLLDGHCDVTLCNTEDDPAPP